MTRSTAQPFARAVATIVAAIFATALMAAGLCSGEPVTPAVSPFDPAPGNLTAQGDQVATPLDFLPWSSGRRMAWMGCFGFAIWVLPSSAGHPPATRATGR